MQLLLLPLPPVLLGLRTLLYSLGFGLDIGGALRMLALGLFAVAATVDFVAASPKLSPAIGTGGAAFM